MCNVSPMMHAMLSGACCNEATSEPRIMVPLQDTRTYPVESLSDAFFHAMSGV